MLSPHFIRSTGLAAIIAGILGAIGFTIHPATEELMGILEPAWIPAHALLWIALTLDLFVWVGIYARQSGKDGVLGRVGFVILFIGTVALTAIVFVAATVEPLLAVQAPSALEAMGMSSSVLLVLVAVVLVFTVGGIVFGAGIVRARVLPRTGGLLIVISSLFLLITALASMPEKVSDAGGVVFSVGLIILGRSLWLTKT